MRKDIETQSKFVSMRIQGKSLVDISEELEISLATANRWNKFFKADIINGRNADLNRLRSKVALAYESYFDFINENIEKMKNEVRQNEEISLDYTSLLKNINMLLNTVNKIDVFRKFSDKSSTYSAPENTIPETDYSQSYVPKHVIEGLKKC